MNAIASPALGQHYRSVFISDTHLGTRGCRGDFLADFLRQVSCDRLDLVGDIIDGWRLRKSWYWDSSHDEVLRPDGTLLWHAYLCDVTERHATEALARDKAVAAALDAVAAEGLVHLAQHEQHGRAGPPKAFEIKRTVNMLSHAAYGDRKGNVIAIC